MHVLVTGGCGFIGTNLAERLLREGHAVRVLDDLSRHGAEKNLEWLRAGHGDRLRMEIADAADAKALRRTLKDAKAVFHLAGAGTLMLLETVRALPAPVPLVLLSSPDDGEDERHVLEDAVRFGMAATVLRAPGGAYGPHPLIGGTPGWITRLVTLALEGRPLVFDGDPDEPRDALYSEDLAEALALSWRSIDSLAGRAWEVGGGATSAAEVVAQMRRMIGGLSSPFTLSEGREAARVEGPARAPIVLSAPFAEATGWHARTPLDVGLVRLCEWLLASRRSPLRQRPMPEAEQPTANQ